ncbi:hypothetical protein TIFTF001_048712 [Ficus carica]|uniref:Uncharacterized protein n=1 Tax=Ficus carica TaxID=3494 RepID=A0AA87YRR5_FICCA|nr:hypothetical protein TIFTF001_048708 [Ficus carica]GMN20221.1 hypothetical protein TIFTF001_048712 [Ficus carica]
MEAKLVEEWSLHRNSTLGKMLHTVRTKAFRESNIFDLKTHSTERKEGDCHLSNTWERGRSTVNEGTVKQ